jgi:hypothetical protein
LRLFSTLPTSTGGLPITTCGARNRRLCRWADRRLTRHLTSSATPPDASG